jgi:hypothetical protein
MSIASENYLSILSVRMKEKESIKAIFESYRQESDIFVSLCLDSSVSSRRNVVNDKDDKKCLICRVF